MPNQIPPSALAKLIAVAAALPLILGLPGCSDSEKAYSRESPEELFDSAREMLEDGNAERLVELLPEPTDNNRIVYQEAGRMFQALQNLATSIEEAFPKEIAELRADAEAAAMRGDAVNNIQQALTGRGKRRGDDAASDDRMNALIQALLADPYGWARESKERLTTQYIYDGAEAVMWDGKPILPPVGVVVQEDARDGTWHLVLPTNLPVVSKYLPKTRDELIIWAQVMRVMSNAFDDLVTEIKAGEYISLEGVAAATGEKAFAPLAMVFFAYQNVVRQRLEGPGGKG